MNISRTEVDVLHGASRKVVREGFPASTISAGRGRHTHLARPDLAG